MASRHTPSELPTTIRANLAQELETLTGQPRPKGRAGRRHDRLHDYLTTILANTSDGAAGPVATSGMLVTLRYGGDVEHRTLLLTGDTDHTGTYGTPAGDRLTLPTSWPLGSAVNGHSAGDTVSYRAPDGTVLAVRLLAVWPADGAGWNLPDTSITGPEQATRHNHTA